MQTDLFIIDPGKPIFVKDEETGELLVVERDARYLKETSDFWAAECKHSQTQTMKVRVTGGTIQIRDCCITCGERVGKAQSQKDRAWVDGLPEYSGDASATYQDRRYRERHGFLLRLARIQHAERGRFTQFYQRYLQSPEWKAKRELVIKRCSGMCEGCGVQPVTEVHHSTYRHFGSEFLFELRGLCQGCHERLHSEEDHAEADGNAACDIEEPFEEPDDIEFEAEWSSRPE